MTRHSGVLAERSRGSRRCPLPDEPFGTLDAEVRNELRRWLVSEWVEIMNEGRVEQGWPPEEVCERPATPFAYGFLGDVSGLSFLEARVRRVLAFGAVVRLELDPAADGRTIEAYVPRTRLHTAGLVKGQRVYVSPTNVRVFAEPA